MTGLAAREAALGGDSIPVLSPKQGFEAFAGSIADKEQERKGTRGCTVRVEPQVRLGSTRGAARDQTGLLDRANFYERSLELNADNAKAEVIVAHIREAATSKH